MFDPTFLNAEYEEYRRSSDTLTGLYTVFVTTIFVMTSVTTIAFSIKQRYHLLDGCLAPMSQTQNATKISI
jgi:hypothetical protein